MQPGANFCSISVFQLYGTRTHMKCPLTWQSQKHIPNPRKPDNETDFSVGGYEDVKIFKNFSKPRFVAGITCLVDVSSLWGIFSGAGY